MQNIIVIILVTSAVFYIIYKLYKTVTKKNCKDDNCGCK